MLFQNTIVTVKRITKPDQRRKERYREKRGRGRDEIRHQERKRRRKGKNSRRERSGAGNWRGGIAYHADQNIARSRAMIFSHSRHCLTDCRRCRLVINFFFFCTASFVPYFNLSLQWRKSNLAFNPGAPVFPARAEHRGLWKREVDLLSSPVLSSPSLVMHFSTRWWELLFSEIAKRVLRRREGCIGVEQQQYYFVLSTFNTLLFIIFMVIIMSGYQSFFS